MHLSKDFPDYNVSVTRDSSTQGFSAETSRLVEWEKAVISASDPSRQLDKVPREVGSASNSEPKNSFLNSAVQENEYQKSIFTLEHCLVSSHSIQKKSNTLAKLSESTVLPSRDRINELQFLDGKLKDIITKPQSRVEKAVTQQLLRVLPEKSLLNFCFKGDFVELRLRNYFADLNELLEVVDKILDKYGIRVDKYLINGSYITKNRR
ncbi:hypothetical protein ACJJI4_14910 [Microbulbifer sp. TRSA002]|uniref:hypothetical protein n=1 Tax=Microbulbifer sp. TRSA002 TaxID=3243382 RepID=UPI00403956E3